MANTYSQIYLHVVFAVAERQHLIQPAWKEDLHRYITGIATNHRTKLIAINSMPDHVHILVGLRPDLALSDLVKEIKVGSTHHIKLKGWVPGRFHWQEGFGAFSHSHSQIDTVVRYIENQETHHRRRTFHEEYIEMLRKFAVDHDERFIFKPME